MWGLWHALSMVGTGAVVLFVSFTLLAEISPLEAARLSGGMAALGVVLALRALRLDYEIRSRGGDPGLRLAPDRSLGSA